MSVAVQGYALERAWQSFFSGSVLFEDVCPGVNGKARKGLEGGVDLYLSPEHRKVLSCGMIQVKASPAEALSFLQEGAFRGGIIPVVIGPPPLDRRPEDVLLRLVQDFVWMPHYRERSKFAVQVGDFVLTLIESSARFQVRRPRWTMGLA